MTDGRAYPRVGLFGNPSDAYGGRVVAFAFDRFRAQVRAVAGSGETLAAQAGAAAGESPLLVAAVRMFLDRLPELGHVRAQLSVESDIPREVGLAGSSAIVIATLRALDALTADRACGQRGAVPLPPRVVADLALRAERDVLGIAAGPQDRVVQAHGGLLDMDFAGGQRFSVRALDPAQLPPLLVAWRSHGGESSGVVHDDLRRRHAAGETRIVAAMQRLREIAAEGVAALEARDVARLMRLVDENLDVRASIVELRPQDRALVDLGRGAGAATKYCGSGGAVVCVVPEEAQLTPLEQAFADAGYGTARPRVAAHS